MRFMPLFMVNYYWFQFKISAECNGPNDNNCTECNSSANR